MKVEEKLYFDLAIPNCTNKDHFEPQSFLRLL